MTATRTICPNSQRRCTAPPQKYDKKAIISHLTRKNAIKILPLSIYCLPLHTLKRQCSGFSAVGSAHVWGARGRWFESSNPDRTKGVAAARFATPFLFLPLSHVHSAGFGLHKAVFQSFTKLLFFC